MCNQQNDRTKRFPVFENSEKWYYTLGSYSTIVLHPLWFPEGVQGSENLYPTISRQPGLESTHKTKKQKHANSTR